ncbi:3-hydroxyacyl-CoA dehydrogenase [Virgisporangium ochraceum]|nr:3-hydroxybutyryl-CoA dehydrogenase [Virgisporangium ochraceum]
MAEMTAVGVVGLGTMGAGIVEVFARAGVPVVASEIDGTALERGRAHLVGSTDRAVSRGRLSPEDRDALIGRVRFVVGLSDLADVDLVVEAVPERLDLKRLVFGELSKICKPSAVLASNTSSLSVTEIAVTTDRPDRVIGLHFFNPAPVMKLVEIVRTVVTAPSVVADAQALCARLNKVGVTIGDRAGFVANALLFGYLNQAVTMLESGFVTRDDLDAAMKLGAGLPMGPLTLLDLIGLDVGLEVLDTMYDRGGRNQRHAAAPLIRQMVTAGLLGRKTGRGFYTYGTPAPSPEAPADGGTDVVLVTDEPVIAAAMASDRPEDVVGLHVHRDAVAEVVRSVLTGDAAVAAARAVCAERGLVPVVCGDRSGRVVNALLFPYLNDAVKMLEASYATVEDIDHAMTLGCGYPAGPFEQLDAIGPGVVLDGLRAMYEETREPGLAPAPLLSQLVTAGRGFRSESLR